jgi:hypothetical protein
MDNPQHKLPCDLQNGESVILITRRHWLYLWSKLAVHFLAAVVPVAVVLFVVAKFSSLGSAAGKVVLLVALVFVAYWAVRAYFNWYAYVHDLWIVTNQRIIDAVRPNWFRSHLASADLVDIEDIAVDRSGLVQTMFNFGEVRCQTAGERLNFVLAGIPHPQAVLSTIDAARDAARQRLERPTA